MVTSAGFINVGYTDVSPRHYWRQRARHYWADCSVGRLWSTPPTLHCSVVNVVSSSLADTADRASSNPWALGEMAEGPSQKGPMILNSPIHILTALSLREGGPWPAIASAVITRRTAGNKSPLRFRRSCRHKLTQVAASRPPATTHRHLFSTPRPKRSYRLSSTLCRQRCPRC